MPAATQIFTVDDKWDSVVAFLSVAVRKVVWERRNILIEKYVFFILCCISFSDFSSSQIKIGCAAKGKKGTGFLDKWLDGTLGKLWAAVCEPLQIGIYIKATEAKKGLLHCHAFVTLSESQIADLKQAKKLERTRRKRAIDELSIEKDDTDNGKHKKKGTTCDF
jgi:hypothetical protein